MGIVDKLKDNFQHQKQAMQADSDERKAQEERTVGTAGHADQPDPDNVAVNTNVAGHSDDQQDDPVNVQDFTQHPQGQQFGGVEGTARTQHQAAEGDFESAQPGIDGGVFGSAANTGAGGGFGGSGRDGDSSYSQGAGFGSSDPGSAGTGGRKQGGFVQDDQAADDVAGAGQGFDSTMSSAQGQDRSSGGGFGSGSERY